MQAKKIKPIAIHLPQFHPFAENDEWWGKGFTEWTNVTKAKPLFKGHYQPQLPTDLGFYDLRLEEARLAQIALAKEYGIYGFCHYHYWFNGKRLMQEPLDRMLKNPKEDFPFMLCWANENWTRRWDGMDQKVLIEQKYSHEDNLNHIKFLCKHFFNDDRYIKIDNKPVFVIYRANLIPDLKETITNFKIVAQESGFDGLHILCMDNFIDGNAFEFGFDASIHFHPDFRYFKREKPSFVEKVFNKLNIETSVKYLHHYQQYDDYVEEVLSSNHLISEKVYPGITPGWDNSARKNKNGIILDNSTPDKFQYWLKQTLTTQKNNEFLFINAWNEWAEGNHLEPCRKWGRKYLEVIKSNI